MKQTEKDKLIEAVRKKVQKNGIPINVRMGGYDKAAEWVQKLLEELLEEDEPLGVVELNGYSACPVCHGVVGTTGYYCRFCGAYLRYKAEK